MLPQTSPTIIFFFTISTFLSGRLLATATCFSPNGTILLDYSPCDTVSPASMCCPRPLRGTMRDVCNPFGQCKGLSGKASLDDMVRVGCTDQSWGAPECNRVCTDINMPWLNQCNDGSFCCSVSPAGVAHSCCDQGHGGVSQFAQPQEKIVEVSTTTTATVIISPTLVVGSSRKEESTEPIERNPEMKTKSYDNNNTANTAGLIIGASFAAVGVFMVVLATLIFCFFRKLRLKGKDSTYTISICGNSGGKRKSPGDHRRTLTLGERGMPMGMATPPPQYEPASPVELPGDCIETCGPLSPLPQAHTASNTFTQFRRSDSYDRDQLCPTRPRNPFEGRHFEEVSPFTSPFPSPFPSRSASPCPSLDTSSSTHRAMHNQSDREGCFVAKCQTITCCSRSASPAPSARIVTIALDHTLAEQVRRRTSTTHVYEIA